MGYLLKKGLSLRYSKALPYSVISVGNITTGGTGKTPMVIALAKEAVSRGLFPIVLTRGYKGKREGPCFVVNRYIDPMGVHLFCNSYIDAGDEAMHMATKLPKTPIIKAVNRYRGGLFALSHLDRFCEVMELSIVDRQRIVFILDDGFQHWQLKRDIDMVLIDGTNPFDNGMLLPFGRLREPLSALSRAHFIVITRQENPEAISKIRGFNSGPIFLGKTLTRSLIRISGDQLDVANLTGKRVYAFCGIGNPRAFLETLRSLRPSELRHRVFADHHQYTQKDIDLIVKEARATRADILVTTEKDMVKLRRFSNREDILALVIEMAVEEGLYDLVFGKA